MLEPLTRRLARMERRVAGHRRTVLCAACLAVVGRALAADERGETPAEEVFCGPCHALMGQRPLPLSVLDDVRTRLGLWPKPLE